MTARVPRPRVLLVDDDARALKLATALLEAEGCRVRAESSGEAALRAVDEEGFDVIVVDCMMPGIDGIELTRRLRARPELRRIPIVMVTASAEREIRLRALQAGVDEFLSKPVDRIELSVRLRNLHRLKRAADELEAHNERLEQLVAERSRELAESERFVRSTLDALAAHIAIVDERGSIVAVNEAWRRFARGNGLLLPDAGVGASYVEVLERAAAAGDAGARDAAAAIEGVLSGERPQGVIEYACHSPGTERWCEMHVTRFEGDGPVHVVIAHVDVTERVLAERATRESEARLRAVVEMAPDSITIVDGEGVVEFDNRWFVDQSEERRESFLSNISAEQRAVVKRAIRRAIDSGELVSFEVQTLPVRDAAPNTFHVRCLRMSEPSDEPRLLFFSMDLSEQRRMEAELSESREQLRHAQKMEAVARLAAGVAHDFNNILTAIRYFSLALSEALPEGSEAKADALEIDRAAVHAAGLTRQLLAFGRRSVFLPTVFEIDAKVRDVEAMLSRLIGEHIALRTDLRSGSARVEADGGQLEQILVNLVINAKDAMDGPGTITLRSRLRPAEPREVVLEVEDDGAGMPPEVCARVFEPFFTTKPAGKGTGLGLATVFGIVQQHNGDIELDSELGRGTLFRITLPAASCEDERPAADAVRTRRTVGDEVILLAEDDEGVRKAATRILRRAGYRVYAVASGAEARAVHANEPVALILSDVLLPDALGPELATALRDRHPGAAVLLMTGYAPEDYLGDELRSFGILHKPFTPDELLAGVSDALGGGVEEPRPT